MLIIKKKKKKRCRRRTCTRARSRSIFFIFSFHSVLVAIAWAAKSLAVSGRTGLLYFSSFSGGQFSTRFSNGGDGTKKYKRAYLHYFSARRKLITTVNNNNQRCRARRVGHTHPFTSPDAIFSISSPRPGEIARGGRDGRRARMRDGVQAPQFAVRIRRRRDY